jgi:hypothetical protein
MQHRINYSWIACTSPAMLLLFEAHALIFRKHCGACQVASWILACCAASSPQLEAGLMSWAMAQAPGARSQPSSCS